MTTPLVWDYDGASYSPTGLAHHILREQPARIPTFRAPCGGLMSMDETL